MKLMNWSRAHSMLPVVLAGTVFTLACGGSQVTGPTEQAEADPRGAAVGQPLIADQVKTDCTGTFPIQDTDAPVVVTVDGERLILAGVWMDETAAKVTAALDANPQIRTIVLANVPGASVSAAGNLDSARDVRARGLNTCVPENGMVASGGTDFLLGGVVRVMMSGSRAGVHSWASQDDSGNSTSARDIPRDDPSHQSYLDFYADLGIPADFYWFTLSAAAPEGIHWLTEDEARTYLVVTN